MDVGTQDATSGYTVQAGDTLQSIAQSVWGDSSFRNLIANAAPWSQYPGGRGAFTNAPPDSAIFPSFVNCMMPRNETNRLAIG